MLELEPTNVDLQAWLLHGHNDDTVDVCSAALFADHLDAAGIEPHLLTIDTNHSAPLDPEIDRSERNRPEWAAPALGVEASAEEAAIRAFVSDQLRSGMQPDAVADLVHDAILSSQFWIVTDDQMVQSLAGDHEAPLAGTNPPERALGG